MSPQDAPSPEVQAALDLAPCGLLRTDRYGVIVRANLTFCDWCGYSREELLGRKLQDLMTIGGRIFHQTHLGPLMQLQGSVSEVKLEIVRRDGEVLPMMLNARRVEGETAIEVAVYVARDRDRYERELLLARRRLESVIAQEKASRAEARDRAEIAEQMVGIVSHDLRNPLQTIQMGALLLTRGGPTPHQLSVLGRISRAGERAQRLIADLLDFTQARLGKGIALHPRPIAPHDVIGDVVDELQQAFPERSLVHRREGEGECMADGDRIAQLAGNLVANAVAYGRADAPVTVCTEVNEHDWRLIVHNHGTPIPPETHARLFQPMVRGTPEGSSRSVGLGLFIVNEIAKSHGGRMSVTSTAEEGTTFVATLPRRGPVDAANSA